MARRKEDPEDFPASAALLSPDEEAGLTAGLKGLRALAENMGCIDKPIGAWSKEEIMHFLTFAVRSACPLRTWADQEAMRCFSDKLPF
jgi:hypothetical protein